MNEKVLTRIVYGSHLFGTNTPSSDNDFKSVYLPSGADILLGRANRVIETNTKEIKTDKNTSSDIDDSSSSLAKFLKLIADGDTTGTEVLLAPYQFRIISSPEMEEIISYKDRLLNRKAKGFVGYCKTQAAKYSIKGSRLNTANATVKFLQDLYLASTLPVPKLKDYAEKIREFAAKTEHAEIESLTNPSGITIEHLNVLDRKAPFTITLTAALAIYTKIAENYGLRAKQALDNSNIDWKAVSHAVRVGGQAYELLTTGNLTFPRPDAAYLKSIKLGKEPYETVALVLEEKLDLVERAATSSILPETSDLALIDELIIKFHTQQIVNGN